MRYRIVKQGTALDGFQPFLLELICESETDSVALHDLCAIELAKPGQFISDVFRATLGEIDNGCVEGKVDLKESAQ